MFKRSLFLPLGVASAAMIAFKKTYSHNAFKNTFIKIAPLSLITIAKMQAKARM